MASITNTGVNDEFYVLQSYDKAMCRPDLWLPAIWTKLDMLKEREVLCLVPRDSVPARKKVIGCRWIFANKYDVEGNVVRRKA